jgi:hypothetical protein
MKYLKRLQKELVKLSDSLGKTATSSFIDKGKSGKVSIRCRTLQSLIVLLKYIKMIDVDFGGEWDNDENGNWDKFLTNLEKWIQERPEFYSVRALPSYHDMLFKLCNRLDLRGYLTFDEAIDLIESEMVKLKRIRDVIAADDYNLGKVDIISNILGM